VANKQSRRAQPTPADADILRRAIHALGDNGHVSVRAARGHLPICVDDGPPSLGPPRWALGNSG
jgi:hypothetical protein